MNHNLAKLMVGQFLSAFADNALLFAAIAMILKQGLSEGTFVPMMQGMFLLAFVFLAPWVGRLADKQAKVHVLIVGNLMKGLGAFLMIAGISPLIAYAIVGIGAAIYGPAKYGLLPELVVREKLVRANGWIEGSTIIAILAGSMAGATLADENVASALWMAVMLYVISILVVWFISCRVIENRHTQAAFGHFVQMNKKLFSVPRARFALLGASLFWGAAVVVRLILVAWVPAVLMLHNSSDVAELTIYLALGIIIGSALASWLIPFEQLRRTRYAALLMAAMIASLTLADTMELARWSLLMAGVFGGLFIVPMNATIQDIGHHTVGTGGAVAVQNFFQNCAMLLATGIYTLAVDSGAHPNESFITVAILIAVATLLISYHLPKKNSANTEKH